jgi:hypothetical protein
MLSVAVEGVLKPSETVYVKLSISAASFVSSAWTTACAAAFWAGVYRV